MDFITQLQASTIDDFTSKFLVTADKKTKLSDIKKLMDQADIRHLPIVNQTKVVGLVCMNDLCQFSKALENHTAEEVMQQNLLRVSAGSELSAVINIMHEQKYNAVLVENYRGEIQGIFTSADILKLMKKIFEVLTYPKTIEVIN